MEILQVSPGVTAFVRPDQGANAGLIHTSDGVVVVDTTRSAKSMRELLSVARVSASDACLVISTHFHNDHIGGNELFDCPILAQRLCYAEMARRRSARARRIAPTQAFDERHDLEIGGVRLEVIHFGGHTPGSAVVWLPEARVLFAGDLIFEGRYPYLNSANVPDLIAALKRLPEFHAQTVVPGHGILCGDWEIAALLEYVEAAWARSAHHVAQGHRLKDVLSDEDFPRYVEGQVDRLEGNIKLMYKQLVKACA